MTTQNLGQRLCFLIGLPRSGTTLLQQMLAAHTDIHAIGESWILLHPLYARRSSAMQAAYSSATAERALNQYLEGLPQGEEHWWDAVRNYANTLYQPHLNAATPHYLLDKTPRYFHILPELQRLYPDSKRIILLRHPLASLCSTLRTWYNNQPAALQQSFSWLDYLHGPRLLAEALRQAPGQTLFLHYENLLQTPQKHLQRIADFLELPFEPAMLAFQPPTEHAGLGDPGGIHRYQGINPARADDWQAAWDNPQLAAFMRQYLALPGCRDWIAELGYECPTEA